MSPEETVSSKPTCVCNGCGERKPSSEAHLFSRPVIRAMVNDDALKGSVARRVGLRSGYLGQFRTYTAMSLGDVGPGRVDMKVVGLLCRECNNLLGRQVENPGAREVKALLRGDGADAGVLLRFGWLLGLELLLREGHDRQNCAGVFNTLLGPLVRGEALPGRVLLGYVCNSRFGYGRFGFLPPVMRMVRFGGGLRYYVWIMFGLAWVVVLSMPGDRRPLGFPAPLIEVAEGGALRLIEIPELQRHQVVGWLYGMDPWMGLA